MIYVFGKLANNQPTGTYEINRHPRRTFVKVETSCLATTRPEALRSLPAMSFWSRRWETEWYPGIFDYGRGGDHSEGRTSLPSPMAIH